MKKIMVDPITRLEGHGKIVIFLNETGEVENAYLQIPELRGFERFCIGRKAEDMPILTSRICGVCPVAHHMASTKALDAAFHVEPPEPSKKLRELMYCGYIIYDHILHFYYLGGPDFIVGPKAPAEKRNILGVIEKVGLDIGKEVIRHRSYGQKIVEIIGGKATHPVSGLPGGLSKPLSEENRREIEKMVKSSVNFARFTLEIFHKIVLENTEYLDLIKSDVYSLRTYYMGLVDENNKLNFYDGKIRIVSPDGNEFTKFDVKDYMDHIAERVEEWTYVKLPYLKKVGWKGFTDEPDNGIYRVGSLARLNVSEGIATPLANEEYKMMYKTLGGKPVHSTLAYHWARLIELLYAAERALELVKDPEITSEKIRNKLGEPGEGVGVVEAARGTLIHHYILDENALIKDVNLIVATVNNAPSINMSIRNAAKGLIHGEHVDEGLLNMVEMAFRAYDPCFGCATHFAFGQMLPTIEIYNHKGKLIRKIQH